MLGIALFFCMLVVVSTAAAAPLRTDVRLGGESGRREWYGWQTLLADGVAYGCLGTGLILFSAQGSHETAGPTVLLAAGVGGSLLGAPIVHFAHGKIGTGFASLGLRMSGWLLVALGSSETGGNAGTALVGVVGLGVPTVLDASVFGYEPERNRAATSRWFLRPTVNQQVRGLSLESSF